MLECMRSQSCLRAEKLWAPMVWRHYSERDKLPVRPATEIGTNRRCSVFTPHLEPKKTTLFLNLPVKSAQAAKVRRLT